MPDHARGAHWGRRRWLLAGLGLSFGFGAGREELGVRLRGDEIQLQAPRVNFLAGGPLERLKNGASVAFDFHVSLLNEARIIVIGRTAVRFVLSYDLWEEKFSATRVTGPRRAASHLSSESAQAWCFDNFSASSAPVEDNRAFWIRLDVRVQDPKDQPPVVGEPGINIVSLVEIFSRSNRAQQPRWTLETGPFRLSELKKTTRGG